MAINKKLIHFKHKSSFDNETANNNILDTSICFIQDSKEISTHGTIYKTVNWSVLDLGTFTFAGTVYQFEIGMTWEEFVESDYNPYVSGSEKAFSINGNGKVIDSYSHYGVFVDTNYHIHALATDVIENGYNYINFESSTGGQ